MEAKKKTITLLVALGVLLASAAPVLAVPPLPSSFYGTVKINGENAPGGALVSVTINRVQYAYATVEYYQGHTVYSLDVPGDDPETPGVIEGGIANSTVVFLINGVPANETALWQTGTNVTRDLTVIPPAAPAVSITGPVADVLLDWKEVTTNAQGNPTVVTRYQVFRSEEPYFDPNPTPDTGNMVEEPMEPGYKHTGAMNSLVNYYYIARAVNIAGPSADSNRVGKFSFQLIPGSGD